MNVQTARMPRKPKDVSPTEPAARLREARERRGFSDAAAAAMYFGWNYTTYNQHERGERGLSRAAGRYAAAFRVSTAWLLTGEGVRESNLVEVHGRIGAGSIVTLAQDAKELSAGEWFEMPDAASCWAYVVEGDSMRPRFYPGEVVVFRKHDSPIESLVGQYCLVQLEESGDRLVKTLREGRARDRWRLESHNADPIEDVKLLAVFRWVATFPPRDGRLIVVPDAPPGRRRSM